MTPQVKISDVAIWIKHVESPELQERLRQLRDEEYINLETDGVVGRWKRMRTGSDGRPTEAIKPDGSMKDVWRDWYKNRRGEVVPVRDVRLADDYLSNISTLFPEWDSKEDEDAFRDL
ncbi:hypothetical protein [Pararhizobium sp.]|uniref:hypothetical protein n=1 Tax=Pararhizobium sp. TaxID=1977563 RepID=UPI0027205BE8|nr:hypothetical protein [Pararhizobium sp.]MDO9414807.1 hypothetical protein [Pararhizobium sp.]